MVIFTTDLKSLAGRRSPFSDNQTLTLRVLEAFSRSRLPVFLSFLHAWIAREKAFLLQDTTKLGAEFHQRPRHTVLHGARLPVHPAAIDTHENIEFVQGIGSFQSSLHEHAVGLIEEILF